MSVRTAAIVINRTLIKDPGRLLRHCAAAGRASGWEAVPVPTAAQAVASGAGLVLAAGGDGTVRACAQALAGSAIPLAIIPLGTANLTARALGVPRRIGQALRAGFGGKDRRIDLALAEGLTGDPRPGTTASSPSMSPAPMIFAAMAGIGLDAAVVGATRPGHKRRLGWFAYAAAAAAPLAGPPAEFTITMDGGRPLTRTARCVVVGNAGLLPGGFVLLPDARLDDGLLDVGILAPGSPVGWALVAGRILARNRHQDRLLERYQARRVEIGTGSSLPRQVDGEMAGPGRTLTVSAWRGALTVRLPSG
jgi:diacylglycerol kinase family enzyme